MPTVKKVNISDDEQYERNLIALFKKTEEYLDDLRNQVRDHFMPRVHQLIEEDKLDEAYELVLKIPCHVIKCFGIDALRQANFQFPNKKYNY